ncbi:hypothetical protein HYG86_14605 [Alkalicella caledoniensis]|uniref:Uncharacterized protein n=1 Tax=Alkalicella caledoniensis TaxID=2731377 RepID=A0A7G9WB48_ALKCA|nr:hypothetical protein [Alkalicella caledoniensis]QNO15910.1 hypothetical protein HYG86_14605 [Alkalicella caledoniensis]
MFKSDKVKKALVDISKGIKIDKEKFLLGTIEICLETYEEIINLTNGLLKRNNYFWNTEEKELISMALVTFAINDYGGGRFWSEFAEKLRYDTSEVTRIGKEVFENFCISNNLYFHVGNKNKGYVTSILCHAIIPNSNLPRFFDFLQDLYFKDLEEDYIDQEVEELIQYMQKLFTKYIEDDDISLVVQGSKMTIANQQLPKAFRLAFVKSPQKVATILERLLLYINQRNYGQMVEYLEQDRFDIFFDHHRFEMNGKVGPNKWGGKSQSSKKFITAQYYIENEEIYLQLPRQIIDSDYINHNIYLQISFGSQVIHEQELTLTKSRLLFKTEQELVKLPSFNTEISYKIIAGPNTIHASKGSLNREFIIFDHEGNEVNPRKLTDETIKVVTPYDSEVLTDDAETIVLKYGTYRITTVFLNEESLIIINNKVLSPNVASLKTEVEDKYRYPGIVIEESTKQYSVYSKIPTIKLRMPYGKSTVYGNLKLP